MKVPRSISKLIENKVVLYVVFGLSLIVLFSYMMIGNLNAIILFILIGFLVSRFSKNMVVVLLIPLVLTGLFMMGKGIKEGLTTGTPDAPVTTQTTPSNPSVASIANNLASMTMPSSSPATTSAPAATSTAPTATSANTPSATAANTPVANTTTPTPTPSNSKPPSTCVNGKDPEGKPCSESMTTMYKGSNRLDYAATVEDAYADLDKILGGDGIKNLTNDTQRLMEQQTQLANAMKSMGPLLDQAKGMLQGFDMKNLNGLASMAKNFGGQQ